MGALAAAIYAAVSIGIWWQVWSGHPTSAMTCGCGDPSLFLSSFAWVAHALAHGHNPFLSTATFHPDGINLLANTSGMLEALILTPVTWLFGPIASLNVANTLAPAVSGMATYWAVRHLGAGRLGALVAGLVVELSPAVVGSSSLSHLQVSMLAFVPIIGVCLYELLARQAGRPWRWGALLAAAATGQFFTGTELFVMLALLSALVVVVAGLVLLARWLSGSRVAAARARYAARGLVIGGAIAGVVLAGPAWFALAGPRHYTGVPWPGLMALTGANLDATVSAPSDTHGGDALIHLSGYLGPIGAPGNYLGLGVVLVAIAAVIVQWRRPVVWVLTAVAFVAGWFALGAIWTPFGSMRPAWVPFLPWATLGRLPLLRNMLAQNFDFVTLVAVAVLVGLLVDRVVRFGRGWWRLPTIGAAVAVAGGALFPLATATPLPLTAVTVRPPAWFVNDAPNLPAGSVVLAYPYAGPAGSGEAAVWQAMAGTNFSLAGGFGLTPGPDGVVDHGTTPGTAYAILGGLSSSLSGPRPAMIDTGAMATVRAAMAEWGVTTVVITDRGRDSAYAMRWFTALLGRSPSVQDGAAVWIVNPA